MLLRFHHFHYNFLEIRISHNCNGRLISRGKRFLVENSHATPGWFIRKGLRMYNQACG